MDSLTSTVPAKRLNLDDFKNAAPENTAELEKISGGVLGACHIDVQLDVKCYVNIFGVQVDISWML